MIARALAATYVGGVAVLATLGFATDSNPELYLIAAALTLPFSIPATIVFYFSFGLLGLVPGANPSHSSGSGSCTADGVCTTTSTGDPAAWFLVTADAIGVLGLTAAAVLNVLLIALLVRAAAARRLRTRSGS